MKKIKKIETLKDLKEVLLAIPDRDLEKLGIGTNDEDDGAITLVAFEPDFIEIFDRHKETALISDWIMRILDARTRQIEDEDYSSEGFI